MTVQQFGETPAVQSYNEFTDLTVPGTEIFDY
jgi:hypothetical protein